MSYHLLQHKKQVTAGTCTLTVLKPPYPGMIIKKISLSTTYNIDFGRVLITISGVAPYGPLRIVRKILPNAQFGDVFNGSVVWPRGCILTLQVITQVNNDTANWTIVYEMPPEYKVKKGWGQ